MRISIPALGILGAASIALAACGSSQQALPKDTAIALETAFNRADVAACVELYTEDAEILAEDAPPVRGRQAIDEYFKEQIAREIQFDTDTALSLASGDLGVEQGTYRVRNVKLGADVEYGEYLHVWRRGPTGRWRIHRTMFNATQAQQGNVTVDPQA